MPFYDYRCTECECKVEAKQSIHDEPLTKCPDCGTLSLVRVIGVPRAIIYGNAETVGQIADYNTRKMGKYELEEKRRTELVKQGKDPEAKTEKYIPPWRDKEKVDTSLAGLSPEKQKHYILTGEK